MATRKNSFKDFMRQAAANAAKSIEVPEDTIATEISLPEASVQQEEIPHEAPQEIPEPSINTLTFREEAPKAPKITAEEPAALVAAPRPVRYIASADPVESSCASLGETAVMLLHYLIENESRHINVSRVALYRRDGTLVPYPTVRNAWNRIIDLGFIEHKKVYSQGVNKGVHYVLSEYMVAAFLRIHGGAQNAPQAAAEVPPAPKAHQLTFEEPRQASHAWLIETHPEFSVWRDAGISAKHQAKWEEEFGIEHELMDTYMRWCAWDVSHRSEAINSIANYFYKSLQRSGGYARPEGYVSIEERRLATLEQERARKKALQKREEEMLAEEAENSIRAYFEEMLEKRFDDPLYRELVEGMSSFIKSQEDPSSKMHSVFRNSLYAALKKKISEMS